MEPVHFRSIWISDTHLGGRNLQSRKLLEFLKATESEYLYLVGDIFDLWKLKRKWFWPEINNQIVSRIMRKAANGTNVYYIPGNHDEMLRNYCGGSLNGIKIADEIIHQAADGKTYLILHGDKFDCVVQKRKWLADLGSILYDMLLIINRWYNKVGSILGRPYYSISAALKHKVKKAVNYIGDFEEILVSEAKRNNVDGMICGHIHHAAIKNIHGVMYNNAGDWVESCTALAEDANGSISIINWHKQLSAEELKRKDEYSENRYRDRCLAPTN